MGYPAGVSGACEVWLVPVLLATCLWAACSDPPAGEPTTRSAAPPAPAPRAPDLVLISIDTLRADRLGLYGYDKPTSKVLDSFAREAVVFERHQAQSPLTLPSHASMLTGRDPDRHGARSDATYRLTEQAVTLPELLAASGFVTGAFVSSSLLDPAFGLDQGFSIYAGDFATDRGPQATPASETTDRALAWLDRRERDERLFLFVHYYDPHKPHRAPARFEFDHPYDAEVAFVDEQLGRLFAGLERQGRLARALVVVTADHGQSLGEHGMEGDTLVLFQQTLHVPLIVRLPGGAHGGRREPGLTRSIDLVPTLLGQLGLPVPPEVDGADLARALSGSGPLPEQDSYAETLFTEVRELHQRSLVRGRFKLISWYRLDPDQRLDEVFGRLRDAAASRPALQARLERVLERTEWLAQQPRQLYDLAADPGEAHNLYGERPRIAADLEGALAARAKAAGVGATAERYAPSPQLIQRLGALGYLAIPQR